MYSLIVLALSGISFLPALVAAATSSTTLSVCNADNCLRAVRASAFSTVAGTASCSSYFLTTVIPPTVTITATSSIPATASATQDVTVTTTVYATATTAVGLTATTIIDETATTTILAIATPIVDATTTTIIDVVATTDVDTTVTSTQTATIQARAVRAETTTTIAPSSIPAFASPCSGSVRYSSACSCIGITAMTTTFPAPSTTVTVPHTYTVSTATSTVTVSTGVAVVTQRTQTVLTTVSTETDFATLSTATAIVTDSTATITTVVSTETDLATTSTETDIVTETVTVTATTTACPPTSHSTIDLVGSSCSNCDPGGAMASVCYDTDIDLVSNVCTSTVDRTLVGLAAVYIHSFQPGTDYNPVSGCTLQYFYDGACSQPAGAVIPVNEKDLDTTCTELNGGVPEQLFGLLSCDYNPCM